MNGLLEISDDELAAVKPLYVNGEASKQSATRATNSDLDVDWDDQDATSGTDGLEKIAPADKNSVVRVAVLTDIVTPKHAWLHFLVDARDGKKKSVRCLSLRDKKNKIIGEPADCCKRTKEDSQQKAQHSFVVLALRYKNADTKTGKFMLNPGTREPLPIDYEIGWMKFSPPSFAAVRALAEPDEDGQAVNTGVHEIDMLMSHKDTGYGFAYKLLTRAAKYRANPELLAEVQAHAAQFADGVILTRWLGKKVSSVEMKAILGSGERKPAADIDNTDQL